MLSLAAARPSSRTVVLATAGCIFLFVSVLPAVYMLAVSLVDLDGNFSLAHYQKLLTESRQRQLLLASAQLGVGAAALATLLGAPLGLLLARTDLPRRQLWRILLTVPLVVPPYVQALAWTYTGGPVGWVAQTLGHDPFSTGTYSLFGAIIVLGVSFYPLPMLAAEAALQRVDGHLEEAGLLVAPRRHVLRRITLPLVAPTVAAAALIVFVLALAEFGVPGLLRVRVFTTEVFTAFAVLYDFGAATALAVPLLAAALAAGAAARFLAGHHPLVTRRSLHSGMPLPLTRWRWLALAGVAAVVALCVALPMLVLTLEAGGPQRVIAAAAASRDAIFYSFALAIVGSTLTVGLGVVLGYAHGRAHSRAGRLGDLAFVVLFAVPSTVIGVGLIGLWNRPGLPGQIYASPIILILAYLARFVPVAALVLSASVRQVAESFEEAAVVAGARWWRVFWRIVLPQIRGGIVAAWFVVCIFTFGELGATVLVAPPGESTLPVRVYTLIANAPTSEVAALALLQVAMAVVPLALLGWSFRPTMPQTDAVPRETRQ